MKTTGFKPSFNGIFRFKSELKFPSNMEKSDTLEDIRLDHCPSRFKKDDSNYFYFYEYKDNQLFKDLKHHKVPFAYVPTYFGPIDSSVNYDKIEAIFNKGIE